MTERPPSVWTREELEAEVVRLQAHERSERQAWVRRLRQVAAAVLVVLTALAAVMAVIGVWLNRTLLETDNFTALVVPAVLDPEVKEAFADRAGDQIVEALAVEDRLRSRFEALDEYLSFRLVEALDLGPAAEALLRGLDLPSFADLAAPIADPVNDAIRSTVDRVIASQQFERLISEAIPAAHSRAVALVRGDLDELPLVVVQSGEVQINLVPVMVEILRSIIQSGIDLIGLDIEVPEFSSTEEADAAVERLARVLGTELPSDFGQVTIMSQAQLQTLQSAIRALDRLVWLSVILVIVLIVAAVVVSVTRRRTLAQLGGATALALILASIVTSPIQSALVDSIARPGREEAVQALLEPVFSSLTLSFVVVIVVAAVISLAAVIAGQSDRLQAAWERGRSALAVDDGESEVGRFVRRRYDLLRLGGLVVALIVLFLWGIGFVSVILVGGLLAAYLWGLAVLRAPTEESVEA